MKNTICIALVVLSLTMAGAAQATIKAIDSYAKDISRYATNKRNVKTVFADVSDVSEGSKPNWRKFASEKALEKHRESSETYSIAYTWTRNGKLVASNFTLFSGSGDWAKYVYHFFRTDGSLAKAEIDYRTFYGDFIVEQSLYYNRSGELLKKTTAYKDLQSRKPKKPDPDTLTDNSRLLTDDIYKRTADLPFAVLIKK